MKKAPRNTLHVLCLFFCCCVLACSSTTDNSSGESELSLENLQGTWTLNESLSDLDAQTEDDPQTVVCDASGSCSITLGCQLTYDGSLEITDDDRFTLWINGSNVNCVNAELSLTGTQLTATCASITQPTATLVWDIE